MLNDEELMRYSRHIFLPQLGIDGQLALKKATVLIVGLGGLGNPVSLYLQAAGVGHLILADGDQVELSNLQRQIAFSDADIGSDKAVALKKRLQALNPHTKLTTINHYMTQVEFEKLLPTVDIVVDATDNIDTRYIIHQACLTHKKPLVFGAAIGHEGHYIVFDFRCDEQPCYYCLYPELNRDGESGTCSENGVFSPVLGVIGSLQASGVIQLITRQVIKTGVLTTVDLATGQFKNLGFIKQADCRICGH